jgi:cardiolipin synthase
MVYGAPMIESLLEDMDAIVDQSHLVTAEEWAKRSVVRRVLEPLLRLFAIWM